MRTIHTVTNESEDKEKYYESDESLVDATERYYGEAESPTNVDRMTRAVWAGTLASEEQLEGHVAREDFKSVFKGVLPSSGQRIRGERPNAEDKERLAHDVVLSAPKSVSMALHLEGDLGLFDDHMEAVKETLALIEQEFAQTRIQTDGVRQTVNTGKLIAALMPHHTSRDGDMQLHTHILIMNGTKGPDGVWRSLCHEALTQAEWIGGFYRQRLAEKVQARGRRIYNTEHGFELGGYSRDDIEVFSKRNRAIVKAVQEDGLTVNAQNKKQKVLPTRKAKCKSGQKLEEIQDLWREEGHSKQVGKSILDRPINVQPDFKTAVDEVDSAIRHLKERSVSFSRKDIYEYAFKHIHSEGLDFEHINQAINEHKSLINVGNGRFTTVEALEQEIEIRQRWMAGQGEATPLLSNPDLEGTKLNPGQAEAVYRTLISKDKHQIVHGLSGVGKTTALGELKLQLEATAIEIRGFSPTIDAAAELQRELGIKTNTVEHLVLSKPEVVRDQLWIIDEAGMISARQMQAIGRKAEAVGARLLLVGDKGQNSSVEAGSPLRSLIEHGATTHSIRQIIRQQNSTQREAVELIASGNGSAALELLNANGYIIELDSRKERATAIAQQYLALSPKEQSQTEIVTGTNAERLSITKAIRTGLKAEGQLSESAKIVQLVSRQFTKEQSKLVRNYQTGDYIKLHRDYQSTQLKKGQLYKVEGCRGNELLVSSYGGRLYRFDPDKYKDKEVFYAQEMEIAVGDRLRWTSSDKSKGQINGRTFTVAAFEGTTMRVVDLKDKADDVSLLQPLTVDYDLVSTSYRAQGKTKKRVIVSATSDPTSSREPFYVKISRQTKELSVYTQDLEQLRKWVKSSNAQENPLELLGENHEQRNSTNPFVNRHSGAAQPDGKTAQRYGPEVQSDAVNYSGSLERLCREIDRTAIAEVLGGLREVVAGLNRVNEKLHRGVANHSNLAREIGRLSESISNTDRAASRATEQRLVGAIQQRQTFESIEQPFLRLRDALNQAKAIKPFDNKPLVEVVNTLQQTVSRIEERTSRTIRDEKLNVLADAISQWKAASVVTEDLRLQEIAQGIDALSAAQATAEVLKTQAVAESVNQIRAEDYIYAALQDFNQTVGKSMESLRTSPGMLNLNSALTELRSILGEQEGIRDQLRELSKDAHKIGLSPTPKPKKVEGFWQPGATTETPPHIDPKHWREWIEDSCVHPAIAVARLQTIYGDAVYDRLLSEKLATLGSGQYVTKPMARLMQAYQQLGDDGGWWVDSGVDPRSFPMLKPGENPQMSLYGTFKPNNPRQDENGKIRKYENPLGVKQLFDRDLNFSAVPDEIAERIYRKYGVTPTAAEKASGFWYVVYKHPEIPIYRTEGNKKDAAITSQGRVVISGQGVNAGYRAKNQVGDKLPERILHPQLEIFAQPGREIRFAFDQDSKLSTILNVRQELVREAELLLERGCNIYSLGWDHQQGKGADDLIKNHGPAAFERADKQAVSFERIMTQHYRTKYNSIAKRVKEELGAISQERIDLEVYIRSVVNGDIKDGNRFVGESDLARSFRNQKPEAAEKYIGAISSVAGTYKRLSDRNVEDIDELIRKTVQRQIVALELEEDKTIALENIHGKRHHSGRRR